MVHYNSFDCVPAHHIFHTYYLSVPHLVMGCGLPGGSYQVSVAKQVVNHAEYANSIHLVKDKLSLHTKQKVTCIKDVEDLQVRIEKLEEIFSYLRNRKLKQKEVILGTDDETSLNDDTSSNDEISSKPPKPHYDSIKTEVEEALPLDTVYLHLHVASSVMGTNRTGKAHYRLRSLGPLKEEIVHVKKPYNMVKVTNTVLGLKASNS
nr:hypothetical protein [Tanacetum cinerariifolium]